MLWRRFIVIMSTSLAALTLFCFSFVVLVDPYDSLPFSLDFERVQVDGTQRLFYPALARNSRFNSAVIGTSNVRLIKPDILNNVLGGRLLASHRCHR